MTGGFDPPAMQGILWYHTSQGRLSFSHAQGANVNDVIGVIVERVDVLAEGGRNVNGKELSIDARLGSDNL